MLIVTDLHLTDNPNDEYRWDIFRQIDVLLAKHDEDRLLILGDLTDAKDLHSSFLVNRITRTLVGLTERARIYVLEGNHDYIDPKQPFFGFLDNIPDIRFIKKPTGLRIQGHRCLFLPHSRNPVEDWKTTSFRRRDFIFCHQLIDGARAANGQGLHGGLSRKYFDEQKIEKHTKVISGDIHTAQQCGKRIIYVGTPYPVTFADHHIPRALLIHRDRDIEEILLDSIKKDSIEMSPGDTIPELYAAGDQLKVSLLTVRADIPDAPYWIEQIREQARKRKIHLHSIQTKVQDAHKPRKLGDLKPVKGAKATPLELFELFCQDQDVEDSLADAGRSFVE